MAIDKMRIIVKWMMRWLWLIVNYRNTYIDSEGRTTHILRQRSIITKLIYSIELEIKYTTDTTRSASYIDIHLEMDSECRLRTNIFIIYDRIDYLNFPIVNLYVASFLKHLHSQYIHVSLSHYDIMTFFYRVLLLTRKLLNKVLQVLSLRVTTMTWSTITEYLCHKWPRICSVCCNYNPVLYSFMINHRTDTAYLSGAPDFITGFSEVRVL